MPINPISKMRSPAEQYLHDFHRRCAGATSAAFGHLPAESPTGRQPSSYHVLTDMIPRAGVSATVLDLGCGDGHLLRMLSDRGQDGLRLVGVDMSQGELDVARAVLPGAVTLLQERVQRMSLASGSVDWVLSHMAIMLMDDVEQVLREIRRILRPGGRFAAIVGRRFLLGAVADIFSEVFRPIARTHLPPLSFGDARTRDEAGWTGLLGHGFRETRFEPVDVRWRPTPEQLWQALAETYDIDRLPADARARLRSGLLAAVVSVLQCGGTIETGWGLRLVTACAA